MYQLTDVNDVIKNAYPPGFERLRRIELQRLCQERCIPFPPNNTKDQLIGVLAGAAYSNGSAPIDVTALLTDDLREFYKMATQPQLRRLCANRSISTDAKATKADLLTALGVNPDGLVDGDAA
jgi:hypothetical protein